MIPGRRDIVFVIAGGIVPGPHSSRRRAGRPLLGVIEAMAFEGPADGTLAATDAGGDSPCEELLGRVFSCTALLQLRLPGL